MYSRNRSPGAGSATASHVTGRFVRATFLAAIVLAVAACSDGGNSDGSNSAGSLGGTAGGGAPQPPAPVGKGSVTIRATTSSGAPIVGMTVTLNGGFDGRIATTDGNGEAQFTGIPTGAASTNMGGSGYHWAGQRFEVTADPLTKVTVILEQVTEATPVLLATHPVASSDGKTLTVDLDIAMLDENGVARETLTSSDFALDGGCDWGWCIVDTNGMDTNRWYEARVADATSSPVPMRARPAIAAAILIDQSADMASFDPTGLRLEAVSSLFDSVTPPDTVTLGTFQGIPSTPALTTYGAFTSDAASLRTAVNALVDQERGTNPLYTAISEMIAYTAAHAAPASNELQRSVVAVTSNQWQPDECTDTASCRLAMLAASEAGRAAGISVVAIGPDYTATCMVAARTGGACAHVQDPAQLPVVFRALNAIVGRSLAFNRVRLVLEAEPGVFLPGRTVSGYLQVRIGPDTTIGWSVNIPI